jgi:hypothetical protein
MMLAIRNGNAFKVGSSIKNLREKQGIPILRTAFNGMIVGFKNSK